MSISILQHIIDALRSHPDNFAAKVHEDREVHIEAADGQGYVLVMHHLAPGEQRTGSFDDLSAPVDVVVNGNLVVDTRSQPEE